MTSTLWRYSWRQTRRRATRSVLTLSGIVIGVAAVVAVSLTTQTMRRAYRELFESLTGRASLEVTADGVAGFDQSLLGRLEVLPAIESAVGVIRSPSALVTDTGPKPIMLLAIDPDRDRVVRDYELLRGDDLGDEPGLLVPDDLAAACEFDLGDTLRVLTSAGVQQFPVTGILAPDGAARFNGGTVVFTTLAEAQRRFDLENRINAIHLVPDEALSIETAVESVRSALPVGFNVEFESVRARIARQATVNLEQIQAVLSVVGIVAGAFVILNTFRMTLGERRQQFAILRALGATSDQVTRLLIHEALVYGFAGTALGCGLGVLLSFAMLPGVELSIGVDVPEPALSLEPFLLAFLFGPGMSLAATVVPARRAARRSALDDLVARPDFADGESSRGVSCVGLALMSLCVPIVGGFVTGLLAPELGRTLLPVAVMLLITGAVLATPLLTAPLRPLVRSLLCRAAGAEARLAIRQLERRPARTTLTCGILMIAVMITVGPGNEILSAEANVFEWLSKSGAADFFVECADPDLGFVKTVALPETIADDLESLAGVARVDRANWLPVRVNGETALLIAFTYSADHPERLSAARDAPDDVVKRLHQGHAVIGTVLAQKLGISNGDRVTLATPKGPRELHVAGRSHQYSAGGMTIHLHRDTARRMFDLAGIHLITVDAEPGQVTAVDERLRRYCDEHGLLLRSFEQARTDLDRRLRGTNGVLRVMMAVIFVVAALGIANTLTMNVLEQTREIGILRAIGMRRMQVSRVILTQAVTIFLTTVVPGLLLGVAMAWMMNLASESLTGHQPAFVVHQPLLLTAVAAALAMTIAAAMLPARHASQVSVIRAIQYE